MNEGAEGRRSWGQQEPLAVFSRLPQHLRYRPVAAAHDRRRDRLETDRHAAAQQIFVEGQPRRSQTIRVGICGSAASEEESRQSEIGREGRGCPVACGAKLDTGSAAVSASGYSVARHRVPAPVHPDQ